MQNHAIKKYIYAIIIIALIVFFLLSIYSFGTDQNVVVSITPRPKIDIILAKSKTTTDLTNFETNILSALQSKNIDTSDVKISAVEAEQVEFTESFAWEKDVSSSIGNISIVNNGQDVTMTGNSSLPGKNAIWIMPSKENEDQEFTFDYNINFGDSFNAAGMLLKVKRDNNTLTGYMLSFNNSNWKSASGGYNGAIWEFTYVINQHSTNMTKVLKQGLNINTSGTLTINTTDTEITVQGGGLSSKVTYTLEKEFGNGYGFFSDHYSHNCSNIGAFTLKNINLQTTATKRFDEVLRQPEWRNGSYRFLVNVTDSQNDELNASSTYGELVTRLMNDNIYFVSWGQAKNEEQFTSLISQNDNKGIFIENTDYNQSIDKTASYIKSILDKLESSEYVIVNEPVTITINPEEAKYNTVDSDWPYGKWRIIHDYEYYENNIGQFADSGKYIPDFISSFDKTGRYEITYQDKSITPKNIYVHRKPVASFTMKLLDGVVELNSNSYDLDKISDNNGISEEEWKWKTSDQSEWTSGKLTNYDSDKTYLIQLRVKDFQNTWSDSTTKFIYNGSDTLPVAMFNIKEDTITKYEQLDIEDQSYDPSGKSITSYSWEIYKDSSLIYSGDTVPSDFTNYELGDYTISLAVINSSNSVSERVSRTFTIIDDTLAPEVVVTPVESDWVKSLSVNLSFTDKGGSNFKNYKYAITDSQEIPNLWSDAVLEENSNITVDIEGLKYLHIIAEDNAGNISKDRITGPYKIDNSGPDISIQSDLNTITTNDVNLIANVTDSLSGLNNITINGQPYQNGSTYKMNKNGTYTIIATDNIGNISSKDIIVTNINRTCNEGLDHPDYSSSYDECPICKMVKNIQITNTNFTYDSMGHKVEYINPDNVTINEYYNGTTLIPIKAGTYNYELKVVYNGIEYKTHFVGTITISKKDISITNISAADRQYDGTNIVKLHGGKLQGIETIDNEKVAFSLSETGTIENKNIGTYFVTIPEIVLTGDECSNYNLIQPSTEDVSVQITPKDIIITNISADDRQYNATNIVALHGGELQGIEIIDNGKVGFSLSETGTIENKNIGTYFVTIPEIVLTGDECSNYNLIQPSEQDVSVQITPKDIAITNISADDRQYNATNIVALHGGELQGIEIIDNGKVSFSLSETGTIENKNIGTYFVTIPKIILTGDESSNYNLIQPSAEDVSVQITQKAITITNIFADDRQYDGTNIVNLHGGELQGIETIDNGKVDFSLPETGTTESKNIGTYFVTIPEIVLTSEECSNYNLIQPSAEDVSVQITQKDITITDIKAIDKKYNKDDIVTITGGQLVGVLEGEEVTFILPTQGKAESKNIGNWNVSLDEIILAGPDESNYNLIQPKLEDITVNILDPDSPALYLETIVQTINNKEYNALSEKNVRVSNNDTVKLLINVKNKGIGAGYAKNVKIELPETVQFIENDELNKKYEWIKGENNTISTNLLCFENGEENEIEGVQLSEDGEIKENIDFQNDSEQIDNISLELNLKISALSQEYMDIPLKLNVTQTNIYNTIIEDTINSNNSTFIFKSNYADLVIKQYISSVNEKDTKEQLTEKIDDNSITYNKTNNTIDAEQRDIITYTIRIYNQGEINNFASKIVDYADENLEFIPTNEINKKYKWKMLDENDKETNKVSDAVKFISNYLEDKNIEAYNGEKVDYQDIKISFKVKDMREKGKILENKSEIFECKDIRNNVVYNICDENEKLDSTKLKIKYFDLSLKQISSNSKVYENGNQILDVSNDKENSILKVELNRKRLNQLIVKFTLNFSISNDGEIPGYVKELKDYIPDGLELLPEDNPNWEVKDSNIATTKQLSETLINPGETKTVQIVLTWRNSGKNLGNFKNILEISKDYNLSKTKDIDSLPDNKDEKEDDVSTQNIIISLSTGKFTNTIFICIITLMFSFTLLLIYYIIKTIKI